MMHVPVISVDGYKKALKYARNAEETSNVETDQEAQHWKKRPNCRYMYQSDSGEEANEGDGMF